MGCGKIDRIYTDGYSFSNEQVEKVLLNRKNPNILRYCVTATPIFYIFAEI